MRGDLHLYLESESLFKRIRDYFTGHFDLIDQSDSFQMERMTFHHALNGNWKPQESSDHRITIFMDDAYEALLKSADNMIMCLDEEPTRLHQQKCQSMIWISWDLKR